MKIADLIQKYSRGFEALCAEDFEDVSHEDRLKLYEDVHGTDVVSLSEDCLTVRAPKKGEKLPPRTFRYTMSTGNPVGPFGDVIVVKGWNLREFNKRGRPFLFGHNIKETRHPLGTMSNVLKGAKEDEVEKKPVLAGNSKFTEEGLNEFNDLTHDMVAAGAMPGGSIGARLLETRAPTEEELAADKRLRKWSFIAEKASLVEFSAVPVGMDPDAVKRRSFDGDPQKLEAALAECIREGRYDEDLVAEFRHLMLGEPTEATRTQVTVDEVPPAEETPEAIQPVSPDQRAESVIQALDVETVTRALDRMGLPVDSEELQRAIDCDGDDEASDDPRIEELRAENAELRTLIKQLEERTSFLELVISPESAGSGDDDVSRDNAGDEGITEEEELVYAGLFEDDE